MTALGLILTPSLAKGDPLESSVVPPIAPIERVNVEVVSIGTPFQPEANRNPREAVIYWARYYGADVETALRIVQCESGFVPTAKNKTSSARGLYQIIRGTFNSSVKAMGLTYTHEKDALDTEINAQVGGWLLSQAGTTPWASSEFCWGSPDYKMAVKHR